MTDPGLAAFHALPAEAAVAELMSCCAVGRWAEVLAAGRPYPDRAALLRTADTHAGDLTPIEVGAALAAHPRIGERAEGPDTEASWSQAEQSGVRRDRETTGALAEGNRRYEERFGHLYLVCAAGRSGEELLADLHRRLGNDPDTEVRVIGEELRKIAVLRVGKLLDSMS
ncbi:2-oxo-4-hydroxy-4-carboxy-5-ureidoimidazoline decarboxylase [soil metagenome]